MPSSNRKPRRRAACWNASLGHLAHHVAYLPGAIAELVSELRRDAPLVPRPEAKSVAELLSTLETSVAKAKTKLASWSDDALMQTWTARVRMKFLRSRRTR